MSSKQNSQLALRIKLATKCIFLIFAILTTNGMAPFCKLIYKTTLVVTTTAMIMLLLLQEFTQLILINIEQHWAAVNL